MAKRSKFDSKIDQVGSFIGAVIPPLVGVINQLPICKAIYRVCNSIYNDSRVPSCGNKSSEISQAHCLLEVVQRRICQV